MFKVTFFPFFFLACAYPIVLALVVEKTIFFTLLNCFGTFIEKAIDNKCNSLFLDSRFSATDPNLHEGHIVLITVAS